ncbi:cation:proton antiporter subunit C [Fusibacter sp. JL216-2]|uniref:cation:proton antiporter subunit C n=1 Tax=Fusibacter sp. JL216-2 TaxID=3071453 RepID=UPI003D341AAD
MMLRTAIAFMIFLIGMYGLVISGNVIKSIISLNVVQTSLILLFINLSGHAGSGIPIMGVDGLAPVDPIPQALMITAIVIGASITALSLMLTIKIFHYYGTLDWHEILAMKETIR